MDVEQYQRLQREVAALQREHDRAEGMLAESKRRLGEHGCTTLKQARAKLAKLGREAAELERAFAKELKAFEEEMEQHEPDDS